MKKTYSESELKTEAEKVFEQFPSTNKAFATVDGNVFLEENRADLHAGKDGKVYPFERNPKADEPKTLNAADTVKAIKLCETLEDLELFKTDTRASVIKALEERTKELTPVTGAGAGEENADK